MFSRVIEGGGNSSYLIAELDIVFAGHLEDENIRTWRKEDVEDIKNNIMVSGC